MGSVVCPNCNATVPPQEIAAGWCEACGKKIPSFALGAFSPTPSSRQPSGYGEYQPARPERSYYGYGGGRRDLASRGSRLGAAILDSIFGVLAYAPGFALLMIADLSGDRATREAFLLPGLALWLIGVVLLVAIQFTMLSTRGQTMGKRVVGIRIVNYADGANPGFVGAVLMRSILAGLLASCVPFFGLVDILFIFGEERRCIHDLMAGTRVVEA